MDRACLKAGWNVTPARSNNAPDSLLAFEKAVWLLEAMSQLPSIVHQKKSSDLQGIVSQDKPVVGSSRIQAQFYNYPPFQTSWLKIAEEMIANITVSLFIQCLKGIFLVLLKESRVMTPSRASRQGTSVSWVFFVVSDHRSPNPDNQS